MSASEPDTRLLPISDETITEMLKHMRPMVKGVKGELRYRCIPKSFRNQSFTWDESYSVEIEVPKNVTVLTTLTTYHEWAFYGFFKPTIAEVLSAIVQYIPKEQQEKIVGFNTEADTSHNAYALTLDEKYQVGLTTLYGYP